MKPLRKKYMTALLLALTAACAMTLTGCQHYKVISSDRQVVPLTANKPFTPSCDGMFVPDATWLEMRTAISDKIETLEKQNQK
jgi:hypothetical protein